MATETDTQSFWEHLNVLRTAIVKIVAVAVVFGIAAFFFKEELFALYLLQRITDSLPTGCSTAWRYGREARWSPFPYS